MKVSDLKKKVVVDKFQELLRSGKDFDVKSMYEEAGASAFITGGSAGNIVRNHYRNAITPEMITLTRSFGRNKYLKKNDISIFAKTFKVCNREARLLIHYVKFIKY